jgi:TfoX/Sxy family transcriptional regulator of competence genes
MAFDEGLAQRIRDELQDQDGVTEKKMFGGLAFIIYGNMACGVSNEDIMLRVGVDGTEAALAKSHTRPFDMTGKRMKGWILVSPEGHESDQDLGDWLQLGTAVALSLPPK